jgi:hypothetical protein
MHRNIQVVLGSAALSMGAVVGLSTAALAATLDCTNAEVAAAYPGTCVPIPGQISDNVTAPGAGGGSAGGGGAEAGGAAAGTSVSSGRGAVASLPFTGDEILVLSLAGAAALAAGTALTVAGRRRGATTA